MNIRDNDHMCVDGSITVDSKVSTEYAIKHIDMRYPISVREIGLYNESVMINYTPVPIYVQDCHGHIETISPRKKPMVSDISRYNCSNNERVMIISRVHNGPKQVSKENPLQEVWSGKGTEISIPYDTISMSDVYVKELNVIISVTPDKSSHLQIHSDNPIISVPDSIDCYLNSGLFEQNMFAVIANSHNVNHKYLYAIISGNICRVIISNNTNLPEEVSVIYTDVNGDRGSKTTWSMNEITKTDKPMNLNGNDFFISTNPEQVKLMFEQYKAANISGRSVSVIEEEIKQRSENTLNQLKSELSTLKQEYELKLSKSTIKYEDDVGRLKKENEILNTKVESLERRRYVDREYDLKDKKLESDNKRYDTMGRRFESDQQVAKEKVIKEKVSMIGTIVKTAAAIIPIAIGAGMWLARKLISPPQQILSGGY